VSGPGTTELWPSLESMRGYLDTWARFAREMEVRAQTLESMSQRMEETYTAEIAQLKADLAACAEPKDKEIADLKDTVRGLEQYTRELIAERQRASERLASMLEVTLTPGTLLQDLIGQAMTFLEHAKAQFRETL
jgi:hypothetical protein